jgi:hypothetical protein
MKDDDVDSGFLNSGQAFEHDLDRVTDLDEENEEDE